MFTISDSESEPSDQLEETDQSAGGQNTSDALGHSLTVPEMRLAVGGRQRLSSLASPDAERDADLQGWGPAGEDGDGAPFRGRSRSAPPALWAAQKYGRQLRRMSDEFDTLLLDKGEMKRVRSAGTARQMRQSASWWSYLFSHTETETESGQNTAASDRTE